MSLPFLKPELYSTQLQYTIYCIASCIDFVKIPQALVYTKFGMTSKASDQMLWVQRMNNVRNAAQEVVLNELIYE
jgi:hypothetical protein